ncbi:hypothetical protein [Spirosoma endbachense]|nr:hypothetical protein [Spirosoma endbachense]
MHLRLKWPGCRSWRLTRLHKLGDGRRNDLSFYGKRDFFVRIGFAQFWAGTYPKFQNFLNVDSIMFSSKDYSKMTLEELVSEEKKLKSQKITIAVIIGIVVGIAVYSATHRGFVLPIILLIFSLVIGSRYSKNLKGIQAEISRRDTVR